MGHGRMGYFGDGPQGSPVHHHASRKTATRQRRKGVPINHRGNRPGHGGCVKSGRMTWFNRFSRDELAREMRAHREMLEEHFMAEGMSPREASAAARRRFGN